MNDPSNPVPPPLDPNEAQRQQEAASGSDPIGNVLDVLDVGGVLVDAASVAVQAGGVVVEAGVTTLKAVAGGVEIVGSVVGGIFDGL